jgi:hypothetical protein
MMAVTIAGIWLRALSRMIHSSQVTNKLASHATDALAAPEGWGIHAGWLFSVGCRTH